MDYGRATVGLRPGLLYASLNAIKLVIHVYNWRLKIDKIYLFMHVIVTQNNVELTLVLQYFI